MNRKLLRVLPFTKSESMKKGSWSFLYSYNLRIIRDIFVYCSREEIKEAKLYEAMVDNIIPPPRDRWVYSKNKRKERLQLEYVHAAKYLGFIAREVETLRPDFSGFRQEKLTILEENRNRTFSPNNESPPFTVREKNSMLKIVLGYERARDFLRWFLDFSRFKDIYSFDDSLFRINAQPICILGKIRKGKKGREILRREIDGQIWKIPESRPNDYIRIVSFVFPSWFKDLGLIDEVIVFPEFSDDGGLWHMYFPVRMSDEDFLGLNISEFLESLFMEEETNRLWTPYIIFAIAKKYYCSVKAIKKGIENAYRQNYSHFYFERTPAHLMKPFYKDSYIEIGGFYRSYLSRIKVKENGKKRTHR